MCVTALVSLPDYFGVFADDVQLEHISALHTLDQSERHLMGETESKFDEPWCGAHAARRETSTPWLDNCTFIILSSDIYRSVIIII